MCFGFVYEENKIKKLKNMVSVHRIYVFEIRQVPFAHSRKERVDTKMIFTALMIHKTFGDDTSDRLLITLFVQNTFCQ